MKKIRKKGFTILESIITIAILLIVLGIILPFFNSNFKVLNETEIKSDLQRDGSNTMEYFTRSAMEAKGIKELIGYGDEDKLSYTGEINVKKLAFITDTNDEYNFELNGTELYYSKNSSEKKLITRNVKYIKLTTIDGNSFSKSKGVLIKLLLEKKHVSLNLESKVYFRN